MMNGILRKLTKKDRGLIRLQIGLGGNFNAAMLFVLYAPKGYENISPREMGRCKLIKLCLDLCFELVENLTMDRKGKTPSFDAFKMAILNILMYMWVQTDQTEKMDRGKLNTKCEIGATFEIILGGNFNAVTAFHPGKMDRCKLIKACLDHCLTKFYNPIMDRKTQLRILAIQISFGGIPNSRNVLFLQIFLKRAAKPSTGNTSAWFP